ncbi:hypothetical protein BKA69DRAFT_1090207 [Paraphysoderma sedebokerense]|nr:hypothetical protein BKA69DRAFT_1090207 [Paraphysoderma sedebokerense]
MDDLFTLDPIDPLDHLDLLPVDSQNNDASADFNNLLDPLGLGLNNDTNGQVKKKRAPIPKLDDERLLAPNGLAHVKNNAPKIKFKGKGHEVSQYRLMPAQ